MTALIWSTVLVLESNYPIYMRRVYQLGTYGDDKTQPETNFHIIDRCHQRNGRVRLDRK